MKSDVRKRAIALLREKKSVIPTLAATLGLDGFVDEIVSVVDKRQSAQKFTRLTTIRAFGERILGAAGMSSNIELVVNRVKLGGNGPILANALAALGARVTYVGSLGYPNVHPAFEEFQKRARIFSIAEPGHTDALEFDDGKLMLGKITPLYELTWENLLQRVGAQNLTNLLAESRLIGLENWTMIPQMSDIWRHLLDDIVPKLPHAALPPTRLTPKTSERRLMFFDLADPEKRKTDDIAEALRLVAKFQAHFDTILGLNEKESYEIGEVLGYAGPRGDEEAVINVTKFVWEKLKISAVIVHPRAYAVSASASGTARVQGPFIEKPAISTGGGDHFNAGICLAKMLGADDAVALQIGVATSGFYVRNAKSPSADELATFLESPGT
jgi:sugar/nucleoside kinase (ribokinase family)